ncbi:techylectin-5B-like [Ostrea edulis]|uniref:techylectin-5B-like n=1 Tax=Ostrea edulis TaxID=37623 RepID=UPI0024AF9F82|nr:techylectin-5B-like [Ostrea edulis]
MQCVVCIMFILSSSTMIKSQIRNATFRKIVSSPSENVKTLKEYSLKHARTPASMTCSARCLETRTCSTFSVCYHEQDLRCRLYDDPGAPNNITEVSSTCEHYLMGAPEKVAQLTSTEVAIMTTTDDVALMTTTDDVALMTTTDDVAFMTTTDDVALLTSIKDVTQTTSYDLARQTSTVYVNPLLSTESASFTAASVDEMTTGLPCDDRSNPFLVTDSQASFGCGDCDCVYLQSAVSGEYVIDILGKLTKVVCAFERNYSWTVIQRRFDGSVNFYRNWQQYTDGFGCTTSELWLGNDNIHLLTDSGHNKLRIEMEDEGGHLYHAEYTNITVEGSQQNYRLHVDSSAYHGNIPDSLGGRCDYCHDNMMFSTFDMDNDEDVTGSCAIYWRGAWWYRICFHLNLNGEFRTGNFIWWNGDYPNYLIKSRMLLRK